MSFDKEQFLLDRILQLTQRGAELTAQRDAALAELAALKKRIADAPIGAVEVYEVQRYVSCKRVAVKLPDSYDHGDIVRVVRVLAEDKK